MAATLALPIHDPAFRDPAWRGRVTAALVALVVLAPLLYASEFAPWRLFDASSLRAARQFIGNLFPPAHSTAFLATALEATWQTIAIATAGMTIALALAIPATVLMTHVLSVSAIGTKMGRGPRALRIAVRWSMIVLRSVPELVFALFFVRLLGLGPTAGVLAIGLSYAGMLAKVFAEILESNDGAATHALLANGSSRTQALAFGAVPQCLHELVSYGVYRWECAVRGSVMMGFVGAGGLGQQIDTSMKMFAGGEVTTLLAIFVALVLVADRVSRLLRNRLA
jgi:phosphonate transport system permease protein